jgi:hypothetical protein
LKIKLPFSDQNIDQNQRLDAQPPVGFERDASALPVDLPEIQKTRNAQQCRSDKALMRHTRLRAVSRRRDSSTASPCGGSRRKFLLRRQKPWWKIRTVDDAQYEDRLRRWDYDMIIQSWPQSLRPATSSATAAAEETGLIDRVIFTKNRADLVAATRALDRVLLWNHYVCRSRTTGRFAARAGIACPPSALVRQNLRIEEGRISGSS